MKPNTLRLLGYFRPFGPHIVASVVLMTVASAIPGALVLLVRTVLDDVLIAKDAGQLALLPLAVVGLYLLNGTITVVRGMLTRRLAWEVVTTLRRELFAHYLRLDVGWHQKQGTGDLVARLGNDVNNLQYGVSGIVTAIQKPLTLAVLVLAAFAMNPRLALVALVAIPVVGWPIDRLGRRLRATSRESLDGMARLSAHATETLTGIRVVQAFGGEEDRLRRFEHMNQEQARLQMQAFLAQLLPGPIVELVAAVGVGLVIWVGGQQVFEGEIAPGELIAFLVALGLLNDPLKGVAQIHSLTQRALAAADSLFSVLDRMPAVGDLGTQEVPPGPLGVSFVGVSVDYGDGPVVRDLDLEIPAGTVCALVGSSGAGKSTVAALLPRFRDPSAGAVRVGGVDLRALKLSSLRGAVAIVSQETFLFDDTIRANIAFGTPSSADDVERAARMANAHDFIAALPQGYDTRVDELGLRLSGGQRQRLCIARALLRQAPILVLDEATSALDAENEHLVQEALDRLIQKRTVLAIAHRLSTIRAADQIVVMEQGRVVERGRHEELLAKGGAYARLVQRQARVEGGALSPE